MTTIKLVSDLHFVHHPTPDLLVQALADKDVDILVVAGDIANKFTPYGIDYLSALSKICSSLIFVLGNHDLFVDGPTKVFSACTDFMAQHKNTYILENNNIEIGGVNFIGATMWYPRPNGTTLGFVDFMHIPGADPWIFEQNRKTQEVFAEQITEESIVVTHHMPSFKSTPPQYVRSPLNEFFVCDVEDLIMEKQPRLWLHGHTHTACNYTIGNTRVLCNPYGYFGQEMNTGFNPNFKISV